MTHRFLSEVGSFLSCLIVIVLLTGCGYDPQDPVYDTAENPENFPAPAMALLENFESGKLDGFNAITEAFGDLYTEHTELLDRLEWRRLISRLGAKFEFIADSLFEQGLVGYGRAGEYYQLASFARPDNSKLLQRAALFRVWLDALKNPRLDLEPVISGQPNLETALRLARHFIFTDTVYQQFFHAYLCQPLFNHLTDGDHLPVTIVAQLSDVDLALASYLNLTDEPVSNRIVSFGESTVDLVACRVGPVDTTKWLMEAWFVPHERLSVDYNLTLRLSSPDTLLQYFSSDLHFTQHTITPIVPSSQWSPDRVAVVAGEFEFFTIPMVVSVGLCGSHSGSTVYLPVSGQDVSFFTLDSTTLVVH